MSTSRSNLRATLDEAVELSSRMVESSFECLFMHVPYISVASGVRSPSFYACFSFCRVCVCDVVGNPLLGGAKQGWVVLSCAVLFRSCPCALLSCPVLSCPVLSCPVLPHPVPVLCFAVTRLTVVALLVVFSLAFIFSPSVRGFHWLFRYLVLVCLLPTSTPHRHTRYPGISLCPLQCCFCYSLFACVPCLERIPLLQLPFYIFVRCFFFASPRWTTSTC